MDYDARFWKAEYERLRRNKSKEIEKMKENQIYFFTKTWKLLHYLGLSDKEIISFYE